MEDNYKNSDSSLCTEKTLYPHSTMSTFDMNETRPQRKSSGNSGNYMLIAALVYMALLTVAIGVLAYKVFSLQAEIQSLQQAEDGSLTEKHLQSLFGESSLKENSAEEDGARTHSQGSHILHEQWNEICKWLNGSQPGGGNGDSRKINSLEDEITMIGVKYEGLLMKMNNFTLIPGPPGLKGSKGEVGLAGFPGSKGEPGVKGEKGFAGLTGMKGGKGAEGPQGPPGGEGAMGKTGPPGLDGIPGRQGEKGDPGMNGVDGENGQPGKKADKGDTGEKGSEGAVVPGAPAEKGEKGDTGSTGVPGIDGPTGPMGEKGDTGLPGPVGAMGMKGDSGLPGQKGEPGEKGDAGITGPPGIPGIQGEKGEKGFGAREDPVVRLIGDMKQGRVEVKYDNEWGTICDDDWDLTDGGVVCRMLGYSRATRIFTAPPGTGKIWIDDVKCTGTERSIYDCPKRPWGVHNCNHNEDAGVQCAD